MSAALMMKFFIFGPAQPGVVLARPGLAWLGTAWPRLALAWPCPGQTGQVRTCLLWVSGSLIGSDDFPFCFFFKHNVLYPVGRGSQSTG